MYYHLNDLSCADREMFDRLTAAARERGSLKITEAAALCGCSNSKISKLIKKLGFANFKRFVDYSRGMESDESGASTELERIARFTEDFDPNMVMTFIEAVNAHRRVILLGYGPSYFCAQYMEYKLRILCHDKLIMAVPDLDSALTQVDRDTLLVIFSTTGHFTSFKDTHDRAKALGGQVLMVIEEYSPEFLDVYDHILFLTMSSQSDQLKPYQKSRVLTFIFIEEVLFRLLKETQV